MLGVYDDQISGWYHAHKSIYELSNIYSLKGYKTPFRRPGHVCTL